MKTKSIKEFTKGFETRRALEVFKVEYQEVGFCHGLWLKVTRQPRPIKAPPFPTQKSDTITINRPNT